MFRLPNPSAPQSPAPPPRARFPSRAPSVRRGHRASVAANAVERDAGDDETSRVEMEDDDDDEQEFDDVYRDGGSRHAIRARHSRRRSQLERRHITVSTLVRAAGGLAHRRYVEFAVAAPRHERKHAIHSPPLASPLPPPFATLVDRPVVYRLAHVRHHSYNRTVSFRLVRVSSSSSSAHRTAAAGARLVSSDFLRQNAATGDRRASKNAATVHGTGPTRLAVAAGSLAQLDGRVTVDEREEEEEQEEDEEWIETSSSSSAPPVTDLAFAHVRPASAVRVHDGDGGGGGGGHGRVALGAVLSGVEWEHDPADPRDTFYLDLLPSSPSSSSSSSAAMAATIVAAPQPHHRHHHRQQHQQHLVSVPQFHSAHRPLGRDQYLTGSSAAEAFDETQFAVAFPASSSSSHLPLAVSIPCPAAAAAAFSPGPSAFVANGDCRRTVGAAGGYDRRRRDATATASASAACGGIASASDAGETTTTTTTTTGGHERKRESSRERDLVRRWRKAGRPDPDALAFTTTRRQMEYAAVAFLVGFVACIALALLRRRSSPPSSRARRRKSRDRSESPANRS